MVDRLHPGSEVSARAGQLLVAPGGGSGGSGGMDADPVNVEYVPARSSFQVLQDKPSDEQARQLACVWNWVVACPIACLLSSITYADLGLEPNFAAEILGPIYWRGFYGDRPVKDTTRVPVLVFEVIAHTLRSAVETMKDAAVVKHVAEMQEVIAGRNEQASKRPRT